MDTADGIVELWEGLRGFFWARFDRLPALVYHCSFGRVSILYFSLDASTAKTPRNWMYPRETLSCSGRERERVVPIRIEQNREESLQCYGGRGDKVGHDHRFCFALL